MITRSAWNELNQIPTKRRVQMGEETKKKKRGERTNKYFCVDEIALMCDRARIRRIQWIKKKRLK